MAKKRGLGRNLAALLNGSNDVMYDEVVDHHDANNSSGESNEKFLYVPIEYLTPGKYQPRLDISPEGLEELSESIRSQGVIQPIVTRKLEDNKYEIIAGERRWRASQLAGLAEVPILLRDIPAESAMAIALIENIQREDLNPLEEALALQRLIDEFSMTHHQVAETVGKSRTAVTNLLRLLSLNEDVKKLLEHGDIEMGHARALLALTAEKQSAAASLVVNKQLSVRETEKLVRNLIENKVASKPQIYFDADIKQLQDDLAEKLGAKISIQHTGKGKGKIVIYYHNLDALDGILARVK